MSVFVVPGAIYRPLPSCSPGIDHHGLILHVQVGYGSPWSMFSDPAAQKSSTWWVSLTGVIEQYFDPDNFHSWAQIDGNPTYQSVETEGMPGDPLTAAQVAGVARIYAAGHDRWGWPFQLAQAPGEFGLGTHAMGGASWGGHSCPDPTDGLPGPRSRQRPAIIAAAAGAPSSPPPNSITKEDKMRVVNIALTPGGPAAGQCAVTSSGWTHLRTTPEETACQSYVQELEVLPGSDALLLLADLNLVAGVFARIRAGVTM